MKKDLRNVYVFSIISISILIMIGIIDFNFFQVFVGLATIFIGLMIYIISSYSIKYSMGNNLIFIGIAYLSVSIIDLMYTFGTGGFNLFQYGRNASTSLWIASRSIEAFVLYFAYSKYLKRDAKDIKIILSSFGVTTLIILVLVHFNDYLPQLYIGGEGFTLYKIILDILVIVMFMVAVITISKNESRVFNKKVLIIAIALKIISQVIFAVNSDNNLYFDIFRYLSKYLSYILLFLVFIRDLLVRPYENIFRAFKDEENKLLELSRRDSLTGLYNHSTSYQKIKELINTNETKICLMMIDIDDFKCINDKYGHVKGDEILVKIADIFKHCEGPLELAGRYGGDEFIVLFSECDREYAISIAKEIFSKMDLLSIAVKVDVTISIGIAEWKKGFSAKDLVRAADYQMYESKTLGKCTYSIKD